MAALPHSLTEQKIADLPWLNETPESSSRLDLTGRNEKEINVFRSALAEHRLGTKVVENGGRTYVEVEEATASRLTEIRVKNLPLVETNTVRTAVTRAGQMEVKNGADFVVRADKKFLDLSIGAGKGARAVNPEAMESIVNLFKGQGRIGIQVDENSGELKVLKSASNADFLLDYDAIKPGVNEFNVKPVSAVVSADPPGRVNQLLGKLKLPTLGVAAGVLVTASESADAAIPALETHDYQRAAQAVLSSGASVAAEFTVVGECTAEVAAAAAPLGLSPPAYAGAVVAGGAVCALGAHDLLELGKEAMAVVQARIAENAEQNGVDPATALASLQEGQKDQKGSSALESVSLER